MTTTLKKNHIPLKERFETVIFTNDSKALKVIFERFLTLDNIDPMVERMVKRPFAESSAEIDILRMHKYPAYQEYIIDMINYAVDNKRTQMLKMICDHVQDVRFEKPPVDAFTKACKWGRTDMMHAMSVVKCPLYDNTAIIAALMYKRLDSIYYLLVTKKWESEYWVDTEEEKLEYMDVNGVFRTINPIKLLGALCQNFDSDFEDDEDDEDEKDEDVFVLMDKHPHYKLKVRATDIKNALTIERKYKTKICGSSRPKLMADIRPKKDVLFKGKMIKYRDINKQYELTQTEFLSLLKQML